MEREHWGTLERVPRTPQNFSRIIWLSGIGTVARFRAFLIFLSRWLQGSWRAAPVPAGASLFGCPPILPLACFLAHIPPTPLAERSSQREGGDYKFILPGAPPRHPGTEPPTTLTDPSIQVPCGKLAFLQHGFPPPRRVPTLHLKLKEPVSHKQCQCRARSAPGDARGEAPCIRKPKISPFPVGEGGRGDEGRIKTKGGGGKRQGKHTPPPGTTAAG